MTITVRDLARELDVSERVIETYVDQLIDIDGSDAVVASTEDLTNASGRVIGTEVHLTADGAQDVRTALAADAAAGVDDILLGQIADAAADVRGQKALLAEAEAKRDALIKEALDGGVKPSTIKPVAELSESRIYQIRDGRR